MIYLDANIFLYPLVYGEEKEEVKKSVFYLNKLIKGEIEGCTCVLTWDEIYYIILKVSGITEAIDAGEKFLSFPNLQFLKVDFEVINEAHKIAANFKIKPRDAIHAASAFKYCNGEIISNDSIFDNVRGIRRKF